MPSTTFTATSSSQNVPVTSSQSVAVSTVISSRSVAVSTVQVTGKLIFCDYYDDVVTLLVAGMLLATVVMVVTVW